MARADLKIIAALRNAAERISKSDDYQWGHMGACNCGFLAQEVTMLRKDEIHNQAMVRYGDWSDQLNDYCPSSGIAMDDLIGAMLNFGFDIHDLKHLERLSDKKILTHLPCGKVLRHNVKADVILYLTAWANLLETEYANEIQLADLMELV